MNPSTLKHHHFKARIRFLQVSASKVEYQHDRKCQVYNSLRLHFSLMFVDLPDECWHVRRGLYQLCLCFFAAFFYHVFIQKIGLQLLETALFSFFLAVVGGEVDGVCVCVCVCGMVRGRGMSGFGTSTSPSLGRFRGQQHR
jgi:hypothetical protein